MRVVFNHLTIGLIYRDFWQLGPALVGTLVSLLYQLINLYGFLPAVLFIITFTALMGAILAMGLYLLSFLFIPLQVCIVISFIIMALCFFSWLLINLHINRKAKLRIFKINYSSRVAYIFLAVLLCNQLIPVKLTPGARFWDVHFKPGLAGNLSKYDFNILKQLLGEDLLKIRQVLGDNTVLFGCTPGSLARYFDNLQPQYEYKIVKTVIPPEHAQVFGLIRDFYFHVLVL